MSENNAVVDNYYTSNFPYRPQEELVWKYQIRDMLDEIFIELAAIAVFFGLNYLGKYWVYVAVIGWIGCAIGAIYIFKTILLRRCFMSFKLTPDHFEYTHGLLTQKVETFQLSDIIEIDLRRSWWERIIHTGTIILRFKNGLASQNNPLIIRGIGKYDEMFEKIDYYRNHHRLVLYFGI